ncbi:hypothetical protein [Solwaraspora sp. WMMD792]|uniref:DUF6907 domain-containing protein n=1 Tax=Solwaraspora sp. WMMD792 TaxID=3016099 RepID=UPI002416FFEE|nr:hypothetical protein [Solwaraspora sp. WMMD792]MDG4770694.1 hypothetical protein [Solwaraspora sp. WMMD792]
MQNVPTLPAIPGCGRPAVRRIEAYTAADGIAHGSLDASVYVCADHVEPTRDALAAAGFTPYLVPQPGPMGDVKRCGDGMDATGPTIQFLTAPDRPGVELAAPATVDLTVDPEPCEVPWCTVAHLLNNQRGDRSHLGSGNEHRVTAAHGDHLGEHTEVWTYAQVDDDPAGGLEPATVYLAAGGVDQRGVTSTDATAALTPDQAEALGRALIALAATARRTAPALAGL